ncbi:MAG: hypothetical protein LH702_10320 [Phormidesmis sp. CAN_BIN44]|nr:hypothetical protein [Phormidesmis sp. CAN_BIN44]
MKKLGVALIFVSFLPWFAGFAVPFLALSIAQKAVLILVSRGKLWRSSRQWVKRQLEQT